MKLDFFLFSARIILYTFLLGNQKLKLKIKFLENKAILFLYFRFSDLELESENVRLRLIYEVRFLIYNNILVIVQLRLLKFKVREVYLTIINCDFRAYIIKGDLTLVK